MTDALDAMLAGMTAEQRAALAERVKGNAQDFDPLTEGQETAKAHPLYPEYQAALAKVAGQQNLVLEVKRRFREKGLPIV